MADFFLLDHWVEPKTINLGEIRLLRDSLSVIDWYLKLKTEHITNRLLDSAYEFEHKCQIRDGHVGHNVSNNGSGNDYELPAGEGDGQLVEVVVREPCNGETSGMQFG